MVHNGIIENFRVLREELEARGRVLESDTDTEVVVHLISQYLDDGLDPVAATHEALKRIEGAFALGIVFAGHDDLMIGARRGSPLAIGHGRGAMYLGSDALALAPLTQRITYLEEGDWAVLRADGVTVYDATGNAVERPIRTTAVSGAMIGKEGHRHFMLKEIHEQPRIIGDTLRTYINPTTRRVTLPALPFDPASVPRLTLIACGTASYACMVAKYWLETIARVPVEVDVGSEFRYRAPDMPEGGVALFVSQSGETADTLAPLRYAREQGQHIVSVVNVPESSIARESDLVLPTNAGPEIGVASTKAFTAQLTVLACLTIAMARARGKLSAEDEARLVEAMAEVPSRVADVLNHDAHIQSIAKGIAEARDVLYLGRGTSYPLALEGALKLKEISYIHAEGYAGRRDEARAHRADRRDGAGDRQSRRPIRCSRRPRPTCRKAVARGGKVIFLGDSAGVAHAGDLVAESIVLPSVDPFVSPILYAIPVQLLAYHVAVLKGTDVDQPRNLAKSVTVE